MAKFRAVFFALDGTLWDSQRCADHVLEIVLPRLMPHLQEDDPDEVIATFNAVFFDLVKKYGLTDGRIFSRLERFERLLGVYNVRKERLARELTHTFDSARRLAMRAFRREGAVALLGDLKRNGLKVGIITNGGPAVQRQTIRTLGLEPLVDHIVIGDIEGYNKPDVRLFERAIELAGVSPDQALHVAQSPITDLIGASRAGIAAAWLKTGGYELPKGFPKPTYTITRLPQLLHIVQG